MREANEKNPAPTVRYRTWVGAALALAFMYGCASQAGPNPELPRLGLMSQFTSHNLCSLGLSPEIRVFDVPPNVATYRVKITMINALIGSPWETQIAATGSVIAEGTL